MKRLTLFLIIFFVALTVPLAYFVMRTYQSLKQEEIAELRYFGDTLFDSMEEELADLVNREEARRVDEYHYYTALETQTGEKIRSPLSQLPKPPYILGYFQNGPDGSFQTPLEPKDAKKIPVVYKRIAQLQEANVLFNQKRTSLPDTMEAQASSPVLEEERDKQQEVQQQPSIAGKYFILPKAVNKRKSLGQSRRRVEEITREQAENIIQQKKTAPSDAETSLKDEKKSISIRGFIYLERSIPKENEESLQAAPSEAGGQAEESGEKEKKPGTIQGPLQVEIAPLQSVALDENKIFLFRRIVLDNQVYRQGLVIMVDKFLSHLISTHFKDQPMANFTNLSLQVRDGNSILHNQEQGAPSTTPQFTLNRHFPRPFSFLHATLASDVIPKSSGRATLNFMMFVLLAIVLSGLAAIYQSARVVVDHSERRSGFVSSVTHELKTPLTNIRLYIEMLEQGIARDVEHEQEYFRILNSESRRLSRLINNVLEFSKLEKNQRPVSMIQGDLEDVIDQVKDIMDAKLKRENYELVIHKEDIPAFSYDREAMIQILINLIENSIKFGKQAGEKIITLNIRSTDNHITIEVKDRGPGIPKQALKKIFDDFFRVDNKLTRDTKGTGIGLALVKKLVEAMNGRVRAVNNSGPGCTITLRFPV